MRSTPGQAWRSLSLRSFEQGVASLLLIAGLIDHSVAETFESAEAYWADVDKKALGRVLKDLRKVIELPAEVDALCSEALRLRNFTAHRFFVDRADRFFTERGMTEMLDELHGIIVALQAGDEAVERVIFEMGAALKLTPEAVATKAAEMKRAAEAEWE